MPPNAKLLLLEEFWRMEHTPLDFYNIMPHERKLDEIQALNVIT